MRKNKTTKGFTNFKMDANTYAMRCKVMSVIYAVKKAGMNIPRVDVVIGEDKKCNVLGKGRLNDCIIWITPTAINKGENYLFHTVLHELVHAIFGKGHHNACCLMTPYQPQVVSSKDKLIKQFRRYYDLWINKQTKQLEVA